MPARTPSKSNKKSETGAPAPKPKTNAKNKRAIRSRPVAKKAAASKSTSGKPAKKKAAPQKPAPLRRELAPKKLTGTGVFPAPILVGCLKTEAGLAQLRAAEVPADLIEIRVDELLQAKVPLGAIKDALSKRQHPALLTARAANEGGAYNWGKGERTKVLLELIDHADALDLELEHLRRLQRVLAAAHKAKLSLILSVHSIQHPASTEQLRTWMQEFLRHTAFCYKIAMRLNQQSDLHQLVDILLRNPHRTWALMGLGTDASRSRQVLTGLGSVLVYGYLDQPTAPGQPSTRQLVKTLG